MDFTKAQRDAVSEIYRLLVGNNEQTIAITGEIGSGKRTIVAGLVNELKEGWSFHKIEADEYPIHAGAELNSPKKLEFFPMPSLNVSFGLINLGMSFRFQETEAVFNDIEKQFLKELSKSSAHNQLIIVENYANLSSYTKLFINTIYKKVIIKEPKIRILFTVGSVAELPIQFITANEIQTAPFTESDCKHVFKQDALRNNPNWSGILKITKGNVKFIKLLLPTSNEAFNLDEIISLRLAAICNGDPALKDKYVSLLTMTSYLQKGLSAKQILALYENANSIYELERLFSSLLRTKLIDRDQNKYFMTVQAFKDYFSNLEPNLASYYYEIIYNYFSKCYDYEYELRLFYLKAYLQSSGENDYYNYMALQFLSLLNKHYYGAGFQCKDKSFFLNDIPFDLREKHASTAEQLYEILKALSDLNEEKTNWQSFLSVLQRTNHSNIIIKSELARIEVEVYSHCGRSTQVMFNKINTLCQLRSQLEQNSTELTLWARITNTLISHCENRANLHELSITLYNDFKSKLLSSKNSTASEFYYNLLARKSVLFENPEVALENMERAAKYFKENDIYELFKIKVNMLGTSIVIGDISKARDVRAEIYEMLSQGTLFCENEKFYNNSVLLDLVNLNCSSKNDVITNPLNDFYNLHKNYPSSNVIHLNYVSLVISSGKDKENVLINKFLLKNAREYNFDNFYLFYLNDLKLANYLCQQRWQEAETQLIILRQIKPPQFYNNKTYCEKRVEAYTEIVKNKICFNYDSFNDALYNVLINKKMYYGNDEGWRFMSRGFIVSDLQFFN